jgi:hypothetical protein
MNIDLDHLLMDIRIRVDRGRLCVVGSREWRGRECRNELQRSLANLVGKSGRLGLGILVMRLEVGEGGLDEMRWWVELIGRMRILQVRSVGQPSVV